MHRARLLFFAAVTMVAGLVLVAVCWGATHEVRRGGAYRMTVAGDASGPGRFYALYVNSASPVTPPELLATLGVGPLERHPIVATRLVPRLGPQESARDVGRAADTAWIAANLLTHHYVDYTVSTVVAAVEPHSSAAQAGVQPGEPVAFDSTEVRVGSTRFTVPTDELGTSGIDVEPLYRFLVPRPKLMLPTNMSGPSAGLMDALVYLDHLTGGGLSGGMVVTATGEIDARGEVHPIGAATEKTHAALNVHAQVEFVPRLNAPEAQAAAGPGLTVVPVDRVADAVQWLCAHGGRADGVCP